MLSKSARFELAKARYKDGPFSRFDKQLLIYISVIAYDENSDIAIALYHAAHGDASAVAAMLEKNPRLVLEAGNVVDLAGNTILDVGLYEYILGTCDHHPDMTPVIGSAFLEIEDGEKERERQYRRYKPFIHSLVYQRPDFDFHKLLKVIMDASPEDVRDARGGDRYTRGGIKFQLNNDLNKALAGFRQHFAPRVFKKPGIYFNYANLIEALIINDIDFKRAHVAFCQAFDKSDLFREQVVGYLQFILAAACDRQASAQGIQFVSTGEKLTRSLKYRYTPGFFTPINSETNIHSGLGFDYNISSIGAITPCPLNNLLLPSWKNYVKQKTQTCINYESYLTGIIPFWSRVLNLLDYFINGLPKNGEGMDVKKQTF